jgi:hypothetical protein
MDFGATAIQVGPGNAIFNSPDHLFVGTELQWFINKLGDDRTDEFAAQALVVWRF